MVRRRLAAAAAAVAVLAGCSQIPTSGPVIAGNPVEPPEDQRPFIRVEAPPPQPGDDPATIAEGFVEAMSSYAPGYETARQYLTQDAAMSWDPLAEILVFAGVRPGIEAVGDRVRITTNVVGTVAADGSYRPAAPGTTSQLELRVVQENGEWRIANPPPGILIAQFSFDREYEARNVYFLDPSMTVLVPDVVFLPTNENVATLLAQRLLDGPSDWLAPAVRTAFGEGAELDVDAVPTSAGVATVELNEFPGQADPHQRELMTAQLVWTLTELPTVDEVTVTSDGIPLFKRGEPLARAEGAMAKYEPAVLSSEAVVYAVQEGQVVSVVADTATPVLGALGQLTGVEQVAVNPTASEGVVVTEGGSQLQAAPLGPGAASAQTVATGTDLRWPAWDRTGTIWAVEGTADGSVLIAVRRDTGPVALTAPELDGREVERIAVSLDGCRIAVVADGVVYVGVIARDVDAADVVRVDNLRRVSPAGTAADVAWSSPTSLVALVDPPNDDPATYTIGLSGQVSTLRSTLADPVTAVAAAPGRPVVVRASDGMLYVQRPGNQWHQTIAADHPTYPG